MHTEIETKLKVESLQQVRDRLQRIGAVRIAHQQQTDVYFDDTQRNLTLADKCLRIRMELTDKGEKTFLTFKGPKQKNDVKERQEIEFEVGQATQAEALISALNYRKAVTVTKSRELWQHRHCAIALDTVTDLGDFVEIEGPNAQTILTVQTELALGDVPHVQESYACLLSPDSINDSTPTSKLQT